MSVCMKDGILKKAFRRLSRYVRNFSSIFFLSSLNSLCADGGSFAVETRSCVDESRQALRHGKHYLTIKTSVFLSNVCQMKKTRREFLFIFFHISAICQENCLSCEKICVELISWSERTSLAEFWGWLRVSESIDTRCPGLFSNLFICGVTIQFLTSNSKFNSKQAQ